MNTIITQTKSLLLMATLMVAFNLKAQLNYLPGGFAVFNGTYTDLGTSGIPIITPNNNDAFSSAQPIGFTFMFNGAPYDSFVLSTNGFIKLGRDSASRHFLFTSHAQPPANGVFPSGGTTSPAPFASDSSMLFVFGQDLVAPANAQPYSYLTTGSPGTRVCTIQWKNVKDTLQASVAGMWDSISFQIRLYEGSNVIEYVYGPWYSSTNVPAARFSAVGIVGSSVTTANQNLHLVKGSTVVWTGTVAVTGFYVNNAVNYRTPTSVPAGPAPGSGLTFSFTPIVANDAAVRAIYTQGRFSMNFNIADSIRANIFNPGTNAQTGLTVTLNITGDHSYTAFAFIPSLAPNGNVNVSFPPFTPTHDGSSLITVSVPNDDNNANNVQTYGLSVRGGRMAYTDTTRAVTGSNGTTIPHFWGTRYFITGSALVTKVRSFMVVNSDAQGDTVCGMILDSTGRILGRSPNYIVQPSDLGTTMVFDITVPPVVTNQTIIAGIAGGQTTKNMNYFLGTSQSENPMRPNPPFVFMSQALAGGITNATVGNIYATPVQWTTTRLMMECEVVPIPQVDVSVTATAPMNNFTIPANTNIPLRAIIRNTGLQSRPAGIPVFYRVGASAPVGPVSTSAIIDPNDTGSVVFSGSQSLNFATPGIYTVRVYSALAGDSLRFNDTLIVTYNVVAASQLALPYRVHSNILTNWASINPNSFGTPLWSHVSAVQPDGSIGSAVLRAANISMTTGITGWIMSPVLNLTNATNATLRFNVAHAPNTSVLDDSLQVMISTDEGYSFTPVWTRSSHLSSPRLGTDTPTAFAYSPSFPTDWRYETVDLSAYAGSPRVVIAFRNRAQGGNNVYISNIVVSNPNFNMSQPIFSTGSFFNSNMAITFTSIGASTGELFMSRYTSAPFSDASPVIATNTNATAPGTIVFTPNNTSSNDWHTITYSGIGTGNYTPTVGYSIALTSGAWSGVNNPDSVYILRRENAASPWRAINTTHSSGMFNSGVMVGFYDFTLGSISANNALPVTWLKIGAHKLSSNINEIYWSTAVEKNADSYTVERSYDLQNVSFVSSVKAKGNSNETVNYRVTDESFDTKAGIVYYRITQTDKDGATDRTDWIPVSQRLLQHDITVVNPVIENPIIAVNNLNAASEVVIQLLDITGKIMTEQSFALGYGMNQLEIKPGRNLPSGIYVLRVQVDGQKEPLSYKIIKQ
jgi:hypothetical protein